MTTCKNCVHNHMCFLPHTDDSPCCCEFEDNTTQKQTFCPYCNATNNDFILLNQTVDYSGIEMSLNRQGMLRVRYYDINDPNFVTQDIVEIKYCPNCGKKMGGT